MTKARSLSHSRFLKEMAGVTIYKVKDIHISNKQVREVLNTCYTFISSISGRIQKSKMAEKLVLMGYSK